MKEKRREGKGRKRQSCYGEEGSSVKAFLSPLPPSLGRSSEGEESMNEWVELPINALNGRDPSFLLNLPPSLSPSPESPSVRILILPLIPWCRTAADGGGGSLPLFLALSFLWALLSFHVYSPPLYPPPPLAISVATLSLLPWGVSPPPSGTPFCPSFRSPPAAQKNPPHFRPRARSLSQGLLVGRLPAKNGRTILRIN